MKTHVDYDRLIALDHEVIDRLESPTQKALSEMLDDGEGKAYPRVWDWLTHDRTLGSPRKPDAVRFLADALGLTPQDVSDWGAALGEKAPAGFPEPNTVRGYGVERRMEALELRSETGRRDSLRLAQAALSQHKHYKAKFG